MGPIGDRERRERTMVEFFAWLSDFIASSSPWVYAFIFFGKITEVTVSTLRIVLVNRGIRVVGALIAVIEIVLWLIVTSSVLQGFQSDPIRIVFYASAFGLGNFLGSWLDERLAFGLSSVQVVVPELEMADRLREQLSAEGFGITTMDVHGRDEDTRYMLLLMLKRKRVKEVISRITELCDKAVITVTDVKVQKGGYMRNAATGRHKLFSKWG